MPAPDVAKWDDNTNGDASRQNITGVIRNLGTYLATLNKSEFTLVVANDTSGGYTKDHVYLFAQDGVTKIDLSATQNHTHTGANDGGTLKELFTSNPKFMVLQLTKTQDLLKANWIQAVSGTGTIEDFTSGAGERAIRLRPNATSASKAQVSYPHIQMGFANIAMFQSKLLIETASSLALHTGVACDDIDAADSNTRKLQAEVCTTTNNNWWLRTADNSGNTASDTTIAISTNRVSVKIIHLPTLGTPETDLYIDTGTVLQKTSNIPVSSNTSDLNILKHSIKNSTGADRPLQMLGCRLTYEINDEWF